MSWGQVRVLSSLDRTGIAVTDLDQFIALAKETNQILSAPPLSESKDPTETLKTLQEEETRLYEILNNEKRRAEGLKKTYYRALSLASSQHRERISSLLSILSNCDLNNPEIAKAISILKRSDTDEASFVPSTARTKETRKHAMAENTRLASLKRENSNLKDEIASTKHECEVLKGQLSEVQQQISSVGQSRHEYKERVRNLATSFKTREAQWKEHIAEIESQLEAR